MAKEPEQVLVEDPHGNRFSVTGDLDPERLDAHGLKVIEDDLVVRRTKRTRTKAGMKQLIKDGFVADPAVGTPPSKYGDGPDIEDRGDVVIFRPPGASVSGESEAQ